ncbi:MAG: aminotransferase class I/II-fold pyridoxal phosphate-dependent enzyme [Chloroflexota bacterium]
MTKHIQQGFIDSVEQAVDDGLARGLIHQFTDDAVLNGRSIMLQSRERLNFGSCSYLGLERHPALIEGVIEAVQRFGTQFSSSRSYVSLGLYQELEALLQAMFGQPALVSASTTLGHMSALPVLISQGDVIILDHQVHASVQSSAQLLRAQGIPIHIIRHNNMAALEERIQQLKHNHRHIWYLADGVYSMYGDMVPLTELIALLDRYDQFHLYIDDAHGMSWAGSQGVGYVRSRIAHHPKMVLAVSLNKAFAAAGGALIFPNEEMAHKVRKCGGTFIFSGPIQPPMLGAAIASAQLHVSGAIEQYQQELRDLVTHTNRRITEWGLPQFQVTDAPLFFMPIGKPNTTWNVVQRVFEDGFYTNTASFPATPMQKGGMRFTVNRNLSKDDIDQLLECVAYHYPIALAEEGSSCREVARVFKIPEFEVKLPVPAMV